MNYDQKRNQIEESFLNGQFEQCRKQFKKLPKTLRRELLKDTFGNLIIVAQTHEKIRNHSLKLACFLTDNI